MGFRVSEPEFRVSELGCEEAYLILKVDSSGENDLWGSVSIQEYLLLHKCAAVPMRART